MQIKDFVSACRKRSGLVTQQAFADSLGVKRETVAAWEGGVQPPSFDKLQAIAKLAGTVFEDCLSLPEKETDKKENEAALKTLRAALKLDETRELVVDLAELAEKMMALAQRKPRRKQP